jgi:zinc transport system substrate-binding protein
MSQSLPFTKPRRPRGWPRQACRALLLSGLLLLGSWGAMPTAAPGKIKVAASILPLADFCRHLGGDLVEVHSLIPPGASPHVFEPPPSVMARAFQARVFVYIGAGLEPWAAKVLQARGTGKVAVVEAAKGIPLIQEVKEPHPAEVIEAGREGHGAGPGEEKGHRAPEGHRHEAGNPHIWLDPVLAQEICRQIALALIQVDPRHRDQYEANLKNYLAALDELDRDIRQRTAAWRLRDCVSVHPAYAYFARRYHLTEVGVIEVAPGREPTPRHLQRIVQAVKRSGLRVVFAEPQLNARVAEAVAREAGVKVLMLDPMGGRPPYGDDYLKLMRHNLAVMEEAMK